jgi:hypothetical protein
MTGVTYFEPASGTYAVVDRSGATVNISSHTGPGLYLSLAALLLLAAGVFVAARPAAKALAGSPKTTTSTTTARVRQPETPAVRAPEPGPAGGAQPAVRVDDLSVIGGSQTTSFDADILRT